MAARQNGVLLLGASSPPVLWVSTRLMSLSSCIDAASIVRVMSDYGSAHAIVRFAQHAGDASRLDLRGRLGDVGLPTFAGLDLDERGPDGAVRGVLAVISLGASAAAAGADALIHAGTVARDWLNSQSPEAAGVSLELELTQTGTLIKIHADDPDGALQLLPRVLAAVSDAGALAWDGHAWSEEPVVEAASSSPSRVPASLRRPVRVLALDTEWFSVHGGISTFNRHLCAALVAEGARVFCVVLAPTAAEHAAANSVGVTLVAAPQLPGGESARQALMRRPSLAADETPDLIIGHDHITGPAAKTLAEDHFPGAVRIHIVHTLPDENEWARPENRNDAGQRAERRVRDAIDLSENAIVAAVGPRLYDQFLLDLSVRPGIPKPLRLDPGFDIFDNGIRQPPPGRRKQLLIFGRLEDHHLKGLDIAGRAVGYGIDKLGLKEDQLAILLRGASPQMHADLRDSFMAGRTNLRVIPRTYSPHAEDLQDDLKRATLALMPSRAESFGLAGQEAIQAGTPVLISARSGLGELLTELAPDQAARIVLPIDDNPDDNARWASAITAILRDTTAAFTNAGRLRDLMAQRRTWAMAAKLILNAAPGRGPRLGAPRDLNLRTGHIAGPTSRSIAEAAAHSQTTEADAIEPPTLTPEGWPPADTQVGEIFLDLGGISANVDPGLVEQRSRTPVPRVSGNHANSAFVKVGYPVRVADAFQERAPIRDEIIHFLEWRPENHERTSVVLSGDGGAGKTQIAAGIWRRIAPRTVMIWVSARSEDAVISAYAEAYDEVHLTVPDATLKPRNKSVEERAKAFMSWLSDTNISWLIVLDDVEEPLDIHKWCPRGVQGQVLLTTRRRDMVTSALGKRIDITFFNADESISYLREKFAKNSEISPARLAEVMSEASQLAHELVHLPLALAQSAAVISDGNITCAAYRRLLWDRTRSLSRLFPEDPRTSGDEYSLAMSAVWSIATERADAMEPLGCTSRMLTMIAILDPNGIPGQILLSRTARAYLADDKRASETISGASSRPSVVSTEDAYQVLRNAHHFNLATHDPSHPALAVRMHTLAQRAALEPFDDQNLMALIRMAGDALVEVWPQIPSDAFLEQVLRTNVEALIVRHPSALRQPTHDVLIFSARSLGNVGQSTAAVRLFSELLEKAISEHESDHPDILTLRGHLAAAIGESGDVEGAVSAYETLLTDITNILGEDHRNTLTVRGNLARWRFAAGDVKGATAGYEGLLPDLDRVLGRTHPNSLTTRANIARLKGAVGDVNGAITAYTELLTEQSEILGASHPDTLRSRGQLAFLQGAVGDARGAVVALESLLAERIQILGPHHVETLENRSAIAHWLGEAGDARRSADSYSALLKDEIEIFGQRHPRTITTQGNVARLIGVAGNPTAAAAAYDELLPRMMDVFGPDHPSTLTTRNNRAYWRAAAGEVEKALDDYESILADRIRILGKDHPDTLSSRGNVAFTIGRVGDAVRAATEFRRLLDDRIRILGPDHRDTLETQDRLAHWLGVSGEAEQAKSAYADLLENLTRVVGPDDPSVLTARTKFARWTGEAGDSAAAAKAYGDLVPDLVRVFGPEHPNTLGARNNAARWIGEAGNAEAAVIAYTELVPALERILGPDHSGTLASRANLAFWEARVTEEDTPQATDIPGD